MPPRTILVTGASSGLGAGLARAYAGNGVCLLLCGRDAARLEAVAQECRTRGAEVVAGRFDVGEADAFGAWLLEQDTAKPIDLVFAAAGVSAGTPQAGGPEGLALATMQVRTNLLGMMNTVEPLLPRMIARGAGQVVVISSTAGLRGLAYSPAYSASKAGVRAYGEGLRALLAPYGIAVTVVVPGFFDTPMTDRWKGPTPFMVSLDRMIAVIRRGVDARRARVVFPRLLALGQQAADLMPAAIGDRIMRNFRFHIEPGK
ncbi:SDR family NAD(P)-dependent oxidoreductase [Sphingomonas nostoxanthinifaciens]|uniref:SDR family NAD(P)-dependent oxidoreductase n=1 Tax=Sphingomonas nostoxanthinifaciens TaxID=2872652 RepID=UPI001CC1D9BF|nr:SDR family NAD(P)-dependent oxidoreductase [Sphingomonas nostoxanthinifaciens]UAK25009.1 SDR family NAD(P)-dependent oxidoreductase [Sphingomonas nostoxanthinifaciens]